jgi:hypothetical protein
MYVYLVNEAPPNNALLEHSYLPSWHAQAWRANPDQQLEIHPRDVAPYQDFER